MQDIFLYRIPAIRHVGGLALCSILALSVAYFASVNQEGIHGFKALSFSAREASMIFWGIALLFALGAACCVVMLRRSLKGPVSISLGLQDLLAPRASIKGDLLSIPYTAILKVTLHSVQTQQMLLIDSSVGQARMSSIGFVNESEFKAFYEGLTAKIADRPKQP
jgi:hypothetical protein